MTAIDIIRKEERKQPEKRFEVLDLQEGFGLKSVIKTNESQSGLGGLYFGSEFPGRGSKIKDQQGKEYTVRWVRPKYLFFYAFGLEAA